MGKGEDDPPTQMCSNNCLFLSVPKSNRHFFPTDEQRSITAAATGGGFLILVRKHVSTAATIRFAKDLISVMTKCYIWYDQVTDQDCSLWRMGSCLICA